MHMRRYIRANTPGATYFFTVTLHDRGMRTLVDQIVDLRTAFAQVKERHPFHIDAIVILPEHLHTVWTLPPGDADFGTRWMLIKQAFTHRLSASGVPCPPRRGRGDRSMWQPRFWEHQIRDEDDFGRHVDYIHFNPVKHGWVLQASDWPYSSLHRYVRDGLVSPHWGIGGPIEGSFGE
jgi:putative transposase